MSVTVNTTLEARSRLVHFLCWKLPQPGGNAFLGRRAKLCRQPSYCKPL